MKLTKYNITITAKNQNTKTNLNGKTDDSLLWNK